MYSICTIWGYSSPSFIFNKERDVKTLWPCLRSLVLFLTWHPQKRHSHQSRFCACGPAAHTLLSTSMMRDSEFAILLRL